jgi:hypothetical protein
VFKSDDASKFLEIKPGSKKNGIVNKTVTTTLEIKLAFMYSLDSFIFPSDSFSDTKLTTPVDIPISDTDMSMTTKLTTAENTPKSETLNDLATNKVYTKPKKADNTLPENRM